MEKALISALAISIVASSAAAEPIHMDDNELESIHAGIEVLQTIVLPSMTISKQPDGSSVLIYNGVQYPMTGSLATFSLADGTQVKIIQDTNGFTVVAIGPVVNISTSTSGLGGKR